VNSDMHDAFLSFYVDVFPEPEKKVEKVTKKERVLAAKYAKEIEENSGNADFETDDIESITTIGDKQFKKFKKRLQRCPDQILRYNFNGEPLFPTNDEKEQNKIIPACTKCGTKRVFELQLLPTLLYFLKVDDYALEMDSHGIPNGMDWSSALVYVCPQSCGGDTHEYIEEFVHVVPPLR